MPHVAEAVGTIPGSQEAVSTNAIHWDPLVNDISDTIPRYFCNPETAGQHPTQECRGGRRLRSRRDVSGSLWAVVSSTVTLCDNGEDRQSDRGPGEL